jgi:protein gp37
MQDSNISWTDHTFNPWQGCTKVGPGCDNCYAEKMDKRQGGNHWVLPPRMMADSNWKRPFTWNRKAAKTQERLKVFCGSMCDVFDKNAPDGQRDRLFDAINKTPGLDWQLLTKRAVNINKYLPEDWGDGYDNVWLGVTVENKKHGLPRIEHLKKLPAKIKFLSIEPLLEDLGTLNLNGIDWVIVGGENAAKAKARVMKKEWVLNIKEQCESQSVPFFFKQWSGNRNCMLDGIEIKQWPLVLEF